MSTTSDEQPIDVESWLFAGPFAMCRSTGSSERRCRVEVVNGHDWKMCRVGGLELPRRS